MESKVSLLERTRLSPHVDFESTARLGKEARELLAYGKLDNIVVRAILADVLGRLDIEPYTIESVGRYNKSFPTKIENPRASDFAKKHPGAMDRILKLLAWLYVGFGILMTIGLVTFAVWADGNNARTSWIEPCFIGFAGAAIVLAIAYSKLKQSAPTIDVFWNRILLEHYGDNIPEYALGKAVAIKKALPGAEFFVEHLTETKDPFIVVTYAGKEYYIDVWQEPGFESIHA